MPEDGLAEAYAEPELPSTLAPDEPALVLASPPETETREPAQVSSAIDGFPALPQKQPQPLDSPPTDLQPEHSSIDEPLQTRSVSPAENSQQSDASAPLSPFTEPDPSDLDIPALPKSRTIVTDVAELFNENILAKVYRTATKSLVGERRFPDYFPEYVPQDGDDSGKYSLREAEFWTCGFFPGTLALLLERAVKFPRSIRRLLPKTGHHHDEISIETIRLHLHGLCDTWSRPLHGMASRTDTHDIGFIVMPALKIDWEMKGNMQSLESIIRAARSLATRYVPEAGAIRSWDLLLRKNMEIRDQEENMIVIIDSLCNLDLLYYAAEHSRDDQDLYDMATSHANVLLKSHLREEKPMPSSPDCYLGPWYSTCHVANIDPRNGELKTRLTHQGYANESTWSRGQAWGILGYAQTYMSTHDDKFLQAACGLAEYFIHRLETAPECVVAGSRYVPLWDFDAPIEDEQRPLRDSSAGAIAANGMLILSQALLSVAQDELAARYRKTSLKIVQELLSFAQAPEKARLIKGRSEAIAVEDVTLQSFDGILKFGTANNNVHAKKRYANHGLVYGDYYLVEFGNRLLRMGLV